MNVRTAVTVGASATLLSVGMLAAPASAAPNNTRQDGLVNVAIADTVVQLPIGIAANVCNVGVNVLATAVGQDGAACTAVADSDADSGGPGGNNNTRQNGLVNVALVDTTIQVPIGVAANICNIGANVLAQGIAQSGDTCDAVATSSAQR